MIFVQKVKISFLSRRCFTLCITIEVDPRIANLYKMAQQLLLQEIQRKGGWRMEKSVCIVFHMTRRSRVCGRNGMCVLQHEKQVLACWQTHSDYGPWNSVCVCVCVCLCVCVRTCVRACVHACVRV